MAVATLTLTSSAYPLGNNNDQYRQYKYGTAAFIGASPSYVQGGLRVNFASLEGIKCAPPYLLPAWLDVVSQAGSGYVYSFSPRGPIITNLALTTNVVTITAKNNLATGDIVTLSGLTATTAFNGLKLTVLAGSLTATAFTANLTHADISTAAETGNALPTTYASGLPFQGNLQIFTGAAAQSPLAEFSTGALAAGMTADVLGFRAEFVRGN